MKHVIRTGLFGLAAMVAVGCDSTNSKQSGNPAPGPTPKEEPTPTEPAPSHQPELPLTLDATQESIQKLIVDLRCVGCHSAATATNRHVVLTDLSKVIAAPGANPSHDHDAVRFAEAQEAKATARSEVVRAAFIGSSKVPERRLG